MATPNLLSLTTINGVTTAITLSTTNVTTLVSNPASSNKIFKLESIIIGNIDGTNSADITVKYHESAAGAGTSVPIVSTVTVPPDAAINIIDKTSFIYLMENKSITVQASAADDLTAICSYETLT